MFAQGGAGVGGPTESDRNDRKIDDCGLLCLGVFRKLRKPRGSRRSAVRAEPIKQKVDMHRLSDIKEDGFHQSGHASILVWISSRSTKDTSAAPQGTSAHSESVRP